MNNKRLQPRKALCAALFFLMLSLAGLTNTYAVTIGDLNYSLDKYTLTATIISHKDGQAATGSLTIPSTVTYTNLEYVNGQYVYVTRTYIVTTIGGYYTYGSHGDWIGAFEGCSGLTGSLTIPNSVTTIKERAFYNCSGFSGSLTIPNSVTTIEEHTFCICSGFTGSLTIPNSVTTIGNGAFAGCSGFTGSLTIPNSVTTIGDGAFYGCSGFTSSLTIPNSVTTIGIGAFFDCYGLSEVHYNATNCNDNFGIYYYEDCPFGNCTGSLFIGEGVERIPYYMFALADFTGSLTIPNSVTSIGDGAFSVCTGFNGNLTIGNSVTTIGDGAFGGCTGFNGNLIIGNSVMTIGEGAFSGCTGFNGNLTIGNSVTTIGSCAFYECSGFTGDLTIGNSVITIGSCAFYGCTGFTGDLTISDSVTTLESGVWEDGAFYGCSGFTGILTIGSSVTTIGKWTFYNCSGFSEVHYNATNCMDVESDCCAFENCGGVLSIGDEVERIPANMFRFASFVGDLTIPNSVVTIGDAAFYGSGFTGRLTIGDSVTTIGEWAFAYSGFTGDLTIGNSVETIEFFTFIECSGFTGSLTLGNSVTLIESYAFSGCNGISSIYSYPETPPSLDGGYVFYGVNPSIPVMVPCGSENAYHTSGWGRFTNIQPIDCFYEITTTANPESGGTMTGAGIYEFGETTTLTATPNEGYTFVNWTEDNEQVSADSEYSFTVTRARDLVGNFTNNPIYLTIDAAANPSDGGTVVGSGVFIQGQVCTLTAIPNEDWIFINWTQDGIPVSTNATYSFIVTENAFLVANFGPACSITFALNDSNGDGWNGNYLVVNDGNGYSRRLTIRSGSLATYTIPFLVGSHLSLSWITGSYIDECSFLVSYENGTVIYEGSNLSSSFFYEFDVDCNASPPTIYYTITVTANPAEGGTVTGGGTYAFGQTVTLTATANIGYEFVNWMKNGVMIGEYNENEYTFVVTGSSNYEAIFEQIDYYITTTAEPEEGGEMTGEGSYHYGNIVTLTATPNEGYSFVKWTTRNQADAPVDVSTNSTYSFTVNNETAEAGGEKEYVAHFTQANITQTSSFTQGWNWWSTYIEQEGIDGLAQLEEGLDTVGIQIKSQQQYVNYYEGIGWMGTLENIDNESSYKIKTSAACVVEMTGEEAVSAAHPITISLGWNWIGYPVNTSMSVATAFSNVTPASGDQVKAQNGYANYYDGMGWMGTLSTIEPGMGILYKSNGSGSFTLVYPANSKGETLVENITSEHNHWVPDMHAYPDNMTVTAIIELDDDELQSDNYELAAFADGECRGSVRLMYVEPLNRHMAFLTITGEEVTALSFSLYDTQTGEEIHGANEQINFSNNATVGDVREPYVLHFRGITGVDEWANRLNVFPNPVACGEVLNIVVPAEDLGEMRVEIINALGVVETCHGASLQTITAPDVAGVYTLHITVEGKGTCYRKLVVK